ncbi:MAG: hypothetical protein IJ113_03370 [Eggerthellaceae bacterium]|nr:hypothetical protein [Eggerthellaceae bacterium]
MTRIIDLPEIGEQEPPTQREFDIPKKRSRGATGCAVVIVAWLVCMVVLAAVALTGGLARLAFWAVGV